MRYNMVRWIESENYDVAYCTGVDLHRDPNLLLSHKAFVSVAMTNTGPARCVLMWRMRATVVFIWLFSQETLFGTGLASTMIRRATRYGQCLTEGNYHGLELYERTFSRRDLGRREPD